MIVSRVPAVVCVEGWWRKGRLYYQEKVFSAIAASCFQGSRVAGAGCAVRRRHVHVGHERQRRPPYSHLGGPPLVRIFAMVFRLQGSTFLLKFDPYA